MTEFNPLILVIITACLIAMLVLASRAARIFIEEIRELQGNLSDTRHEILETLRKEKFAIFMSKGRKGA